MSLISVAVYDTEENQRSEYTEKTLRSLMDTVDFSKHRLIIIDNNSCSKTKEILAFYQDYTNTTPSGYRDSIDIITLPENIGTARAINKAWKLRKPGENAIKLDNDVLIHSNNWVEAMEEAIERDPRIGIVGLKRKDLAERPDSDNPWYKSALYFLPHESGQSWIPFEEVQHVMGTCQIFSSACLDKLGYLNQPGLYGFDDSLASYRARLAGFIVGFLPAINIDHIDVNENPYWKEKERIAGEGMQKYNELCQKYKSGELDVYYKDE